MRRPAKNQVGWFLDILIVENRVPPEILKKACDAWFKTMAKVVVDIEKKRLALGGELHADAEAFLLASGSHQENLWGANFYPWESSENRIEYTALINIRPALGNRGMEIVNPEIRNQVKKIVEQLLLSPDELLA